MKRKAEDDLEKAQERPEKKPYSQKISLRFDNETQQVAKQALCILVSTDPMCIILSYMHAFRGTKARELVRMTGDRRDVWHQPQSFVTNGSEIFVVFAAGVPIKVFDIKDGRFLREFGEPDKIPLSVDVSGGRVLMGLVSSITVYASENGQFIAEWPLPNKTIADICFGKDVVYALCTETDMLLYLDPESGARRTGGMGTPQSARTLFFDEPSNECYVTVPERARVVAIPLPPWRGHFMHRVFDLQDSRPSHAVVFGDEVLIADRSLNCIHAFDRQTCARKISFTLSKNAFRPVRLALKESSQEVLALDGYTDTISVFC
jgi:hypothetical protein